MKPMSIGRWSKWAAALALPALVLTPWAFTQGSDATPQPPAKTGVGLVRVVDDGSDAPETLEAFDRVRWQAALVIEDLELRERNFGELVELARRAPEARSALEDWVDGGDPELAWTARLALREVGPTAGIFRMNGPLGTHGVQGRFGDLYEQLRELESMVDGLGRGHGLWVAPDAQWHMPSTPGMPPGMTSESHSYQVEIGPDGARVKMTEQVDGEEVVNEYEGESLETLLEANPELRGKIQVRVGGPDSPFSALRRRGLLNVDPMQPRTDILGIEYEDPSAKVIAARDLEPGIGLVVLRTVPGTIAHILGVKRGDVLVELNQNRLYSGDDVSRVLHERQEDGEVVVTLVDARGQRRSLTWRPSGSQ